MKVYVTVEVLVDEAGITHPKVIIWNDGRRFEITSISDVRQAACQNAGGTGIRYTCRIGDRDAFLYYENPKWFVDSK